MTGKVYLVGAGPGDPELLTLKAVRLLRSADVVLHDELVGAEILGFVPASSQIHNVGKRAGQKSTSQEEINALLVQYALMGLQVVRLKGGDPLIFGRAGEEIEALREANIEFEIVPGITAALGAAADFQIPLTHRRLASSLIVLTGHRCKDGDTDWPESIPATATVLIYMPGYNFIVTARNLVAAGVKPETPCAIVSKATSQDEQIYQTTVQELPSAPRLAAPTLLVVGEVVRLSKSASVSHLLASHAYSEFVQSEAAFFTSTHKQDSIQERSL
ncbi:MAG TPA: uroporphyrinogen-III C-methyltransferase [Terriglobales bacterium]|nr:uroporphyrinogen-III C-methyltransferase [Terriglobales bacterium]